MNDTIAVVPASSVTSAPRPVETRLNGAVLVAVVCLGYTLVYWNRFLAPSCSGTFFFVAEQILGGRMPYRDFFLITPPLHPLKLALLLEVFGDKLVVLRAEAMLERAALGVLLYLWLCRYFRVTAAFIAAVVAMVMFAGDSADPLTSYHHDSVLWATGAGFAAAKWADQGRSGRPVLLALICGVCAALCFATKQTTGAGITVAIPALMTLVEARRGRASKLARFLSSYVIGWIAVAAPLALWLIQGHAFGAFVSCVFGSTSAKGAGLTLLLRPIVQEPALFVVAGLVTVIVLLVVCTWDAKGPARPLGMMWWFAGLSFAVAAAAVLARSHHGWISVLYLTVRLFVIPGTLCACGFFLVRSARGVIHGREWTDEAGMLILSGTSLTAAYMLGLSWAMFEPMVVPGLALALAFALDRAYNWRSELACATVALAILFSQAAEKFQHPFGWMLWDEPPVVVSDRASKLPQLIGLRLSVETLNITEEIVELTRAATTARDTIFVYPYFPLFYVLAERRPPTYGWVHYVDVTPDSLAERDAATLLRDPPAVIVYLDEPPAVVQEYEAVFRDGKRSGTRLIAIAIQTLSPQYTRVRSFRLPGSRRELFVLIRNDRLRH